MAGIREKTDERKYAEGKWERGAGDGERCVRGEGKRQQCARGWERRGSAGAGGTVSESDPY